MILTPIPFCRYRITGIFQLFLITNVVIDFASFNVGIWVVFKHNKAIFGASWGGYGLAARLPLNRPVFVKRKHNLLSAGADHVSTIIIVYQLIIWLFLCDLRDISIGYLPASLPIKGWISLHSHVTYAHNSGIRRHIYGKSALSIPYSPLMDCYFYTSANREWAVNRICLMAFLHCLL